MIMGSAICLVGILTLNFLSCEALLEFGRIENSNAAPGGGVASAMNVMVSMHSTVGSVIHQISQKRYSSRNSAATALANGLKSHMRISQAPVLAALSLYGVQVKSFWITNQILVKGATPTVISMLLGLSGVRDVVEEITFPLLPVFNVTTGSPPNGPEWNVKIMQAHKIWNKTRGEGVVVAGIDTGVRRTHTSVKSNYVGNDKNGWYDPILFTNEPNDLHGHGTHTIGTTVGTNGVGVAPGAKWMACRGCFLANCVQHAIVECGQFMICPNDPNRDTKKKCKNLPNVINNSWGGPSGQDWFDKIIEAWKAAGIIPFFAIGNSGPRCETTGNPGDHPDVIGVGSTDKEDRLSKFSSRGPATKVESITSTNKNDLDLNLRDLLYFLGSATKKKSKTLLIKPDICAPGQAINSANILSDSSYKVQSGTSMASPAATGAAALLLSVNPNLTYASLKRLLTSTASQQLLATDTEQCGNINEKNFPNNMYGYGRIDLVKAYEKLIKDMKNKG